MKQRRTAQESPVGPAEGPSRTGKAPASPMSRAFREKMKRKLEILAAEIDVLEREKARERDAQALVEVEKKREVRRKAEKYRKTETQIKNEEPPSRAERRGQSQASVSSFNRMIFEMENLPLEYVLSQSCKVVLTEEWLVSSAERDVLRRVSEVRKLQEEGLFLEAKRKGGALPLDEIKLARKEILTRAKKGREILKRLAEECNPLVISRQPKASPRGTVEEKDLIIPRRALQVRPARAQGLRAAEGRFYVWEPGASQEEIYRRLLHLFSLMKSNKSSVRFAVPLSKKGSVTSHSSHVACLEKIKNEIGKLSTVSELTRYRQGKKAMSSEQGAKPMHLSMYKTRKHGVPIPHSLEERQKRAKQEELSRHRGDAEGKKMVPLFDEQSVNRHPQLNLTTLGPDPGSGHAFNASANSPKSPPG